MRTTTTADVGGIGVKDALVVCLAIFAKCLDDGRIRFDAVGFEGAEHHAQATVWHDSALERSVGLEADNDFVFLIDVTRRMGGNGAGYLRNIEHALLALFDEERLQLFPDLTGSFDGFCQES